MAALQEKEEFTDDLAAYTAGSVLEAGADTTSDILYGFLQAMILYPEVQRKAQQEIDEVAGHDRLPEVSDYSHLPYIRRCVKEATRWMPTTILAFPHAVMEDDEYLGYRIPKGASVISNAYTIAMDPERHPDPLRFDPGRFTGNDLNLVESITNIDPAKRPTFIFGAGRRNPVRMALDVVLRCTFDVLPAKDDNGEDIIPDASKLTQGFACMPEPYQCVLRPRSAEKADMVRQSWADAQRELDPVTKEWKT